MSTPIYLFVPFCCCPISWRWWSSALRLLLLPGARQEQDERIEQESAGHDDGNDGEQDAHPLFKFIIIIFVSIYYYYYYYFNFIIFFVC